MNAAQLLEEFSERGIGIWPDGDLLRLKPKSKLDDRLLEEVRAHKPELLALLNSEWPQESLDYVKRFQHAAARLYPLLGKTVHTSRGRGRLLQVLGRAAAVALEGKDDVTYLPWQEVNPVISGRKKRWENDRHNRHTVTTDASTRLPAT